MGQNLLISILMGWTSIYQLFCGSLGTRVMTHSQFIPVLQCHPMFTLRNPTLRRKALRRLSVVSAPKGSRAGLTDKVGKWNMLNEPQFMKTQFIIVYQCSSKRLRDLHFQHDIVPICSYTQPVVSWWVSGLDQLVTPYQGDSSLSGAIPTIPSLKPWLFNALRTEKPPSLIAKS